MHLDVSIPLLPILVVIMPNLHASINLTRSSTLAFKSGFVMLASLYGSAGLLPVSVLLKDILGAGVVNRRWFGCLNTRLVVVAADRVSRADGRSEGIPSEGNGADGKHLVVGNMCLKDCIAVDIAHLWKLVQVLWI